MPSHLSSPLNIKTIFQASADEMSALSDIALSLQTLTQRCMSSADELSSEDASILQSLDYLTQSLSALSGVFEGAAEEAEADWTMMQLPALEAMTLTGLRNSLFNITPLKPQPTMPQGSCELFD